MCKILSGLEPTAAVCLGVKEACTLASRLVLKGSDPLGLLS